jgi:hypothetical protein
LNYQRLSTALTSINEIPEQVGEVFQQSATNLLDEVQGEVTVARDLIKSEQEKHWEKTQAQVVNEDFTTDSTDRAAQAEKAAQSITMIPDMIMASFENSFAKAMSTVRIRVDDVIQGLECSDMAKEQMVKQMWAIPEEVRQITREAVKQASRESREKVVEQLDCVLQSFTDDGGETMPEAIEQAKSQIVAKVPKKWPDTLRAATQAAESNICQAIKFVEAKSDVTGVVANRVVADTLLRAKVGPKLEKALQAGEENSGLETLRICNPGSVGHPQLCSRACLYFSLGKCTNGMTCDFCHAPHSKRATHLDKRHREMLRCMDFSERFHHIYPILKSKLQALEVSEDVIEFLETLNEMAGPRVQSVISTVMQQAEGKKKCKEVRTLQVALRFLSVRSLLTLLQHAPPEGSAEQVAVEELMTRVRPTHAPGAWAAAAVNFQAEDADEDRLSAARSRTSCRSRTPSDSEPRLSHSKVFEDEGH